MADYKLDIFEILGKLNSPKSGDIYSKLSDDEKKGFSALIVMRWMSGTSDERQIIMLNEFVNKYVFSLASHPHLLMQLLQVASSKTPKRYQWLGVKSNKKNKLSKKAVKEYYEMSDREIELLSPFPDNNSIMEMAEELGWDKDEINSLKKELKDGP